MAPPLTEPVDGVARVLHRAEDDFGVEVVGHLGDELRLDRQLLVEQGEVELQLAVVRDDDALALRVVLRPARATQHL